MGTENKDAKRGEALLKLEANTLAACAGLACKLDRGRAGAGCVVETCRKAGAAL